SPQCLIPRPERGMQGLGHRRRPARRRRAGRSVEDGVHRNTVLSYSIARNSGDTGREQEVSNAEGNRSIAKSNQSGQNGWTPPRSPTMPATPSAADPRIEAVREFNRFYTRRIGVLQESLLETKFSLTESRLLWEFAHRERVTATELARDLGLDPGYLSRLLRGFKDKGLIK